MSDASQAARQRWGTACRADTSAPVARLVPEERAIGLSFNGRPHTVLMATPADQRDLAIGFTVTEAIAAYGDIREVRLEATDAGDLVDVILAGRLDGRTARPRTLEGRSSCGLCGVQRLADAVRPLPPVTSAARFRRAALQRAVDAVEAAQALGRLTRATHAAAFATADGDLSHVREDVGRHNALDKLAGALFAAGCDPAAGFVVVTSRCSFEMVEKTARIGCPMIVAVSAPTDLAIQRAEAAGVTLVALARADGHVVFTHPWRLGLPATSRKPEMSHDG